MSSAFKTAGTLLATEGPLKTAFITPPGWEPSTALSGTLARLCYSDGLLFWAISTNISTYYSGIESGIP